MTSGKYSNSGAIIVALGVVMTIFALMGYMAISENEYGASVSLVVATIAALAVVVMYVGGNKADRQLEEDIRQVAASHDSGNKN